MATVEVDAEKGKKVNEKGFHAGEEVPVDIPIQEVKGCAIQDKGIDYLFSFTRNIRKEIFRYQANQQPAAKEEDEREKDS
jgi:hypothetical protein